MSILADAALDGPDILPVPVAPPDDPFWFGYRLVPMFDAQGNEVDWRQEPLSHDDILHPQEEDRSSENNDHERLRHFLATIFRLFVEARLGVVRCDMRTDWGVAGEGVLAPDVAVYLGRPPSDQPFETTHYVGADGLLPQIVVEVVSPQSRKHDRESKPEQYHRLGVPRYILIDAPRFGGPLVLRPYRWAIDRYEAEPLDAHGRVLFEELGLLLGVEGRTAAFFRADSSERIGDYLEVDAERRRAEERTALMAQERDDALRARAAAESARSAAEARAVAEAAARAATEARLRELEAKLRRLDEQASTD